MAGESYKLGQNRHLENFLNKVILCLLVIELHTKNMFYWGKSFSFFKLVKGKMKIPIFLFG